MRISQNQDAYRLNPQVRVTTSWDDGHPMDLKLAEVLSEFGIKGTFYVTPRNRERAVMPISDLRTLSENFEIGAHTLTHPDLRSLNDQQLKNEINGSKAELESVLGTPISMFCYPKGLYNKRVCQAVKNADLIGARTTKQYYLDPGVDPWEIPSTIMVDPLPHWIRLRHELRTGNWRGLKVLWQRGTGTSWVDLACGLFEEALANGGVWHLWGHSLEIEEYNLWDGLRIVLKAVAHHKNVIYMTNTQVVRDLGLSKHK